MHFSRYAILIAAAASVCQAQYAANWYIVGKGATVTQAIAAAKFIRRTSIVHAASETGWDVRGVTVAGQTIAQGVGNVFMTGFDFMVPNMAGVLGAVRLHPCSECGRCMLVGQPNPEDTLGVSHPHGIEFERLAIQLMTATGDLTGNTAGNLNDYRAMAEFMCVACCSCNAWHYVKTANRVQGLGGQTLAELLTGAEVMIQNTHRCREQWRALVASVMSIEQHLARQINQLDRRRTTIQALGAPGRDAWEKLKVKVDIVEWMFAWEKPKYVVHTPMEPSKWIEGAQQRQTGGTSRIMGLDMIGPNHFLSASPRSWKRGLWRPSPEVVLAIGMFGFGFAFANAPGFVLAFGFVSAAFVLAFGFVLACARAFGFKRPLRRL